MSNILDQFGDLASMGADALLDLLAAVVDAMGTGTEFTGEQLARLGELQQRLADLMRREQGGT